MYLASVFVLTSNKTRSTYDTIFNELQNLNEFNFNPPVIVTDFEQAVITSIKTHFPSSKLQGCYFHFAQCIYRAIKRFGLHTKYVADLDFALQINMLIALPFVPVADVENVYSELLRYGIFQLSDMNESTNRSVRQLLAYFEGTWMGEKARDSTRPPKFPPSLWNVSEAVMNDRSRTNNSVEAWHNAIRTCVGTNGNVYNFVEFLQKEESLSIYRQRQNEDFDRNKSIKRRKYAEKDGKIKAIVNSYSISRNKIAYLKRVAKIIHLPNA